MGHESELPPAMTRGLVLPLQEQGSGRALACVSHGRNRLWIQAPTIVDPRRCRFDGWDNVCAATTRGCSGDPARPEGAGREGCWQWRSAAALGAGQDFHAWGWIRPQCEYHHGKRYVNFAKRTECNWCDSSSVSGLNKKVAWPRGFQGFQWEPLSIPIKLEQDHRWRGKRGEAEHLSHRAGA